MDKKNIRQLESIIWIVSFKQMQTAENNKQPTQIIIIHAIDWKICVSVQCTKYVHFIL